MRRKYNAAGRPSSYTATASRPGRSRQGGITGQAKWVRPAATGAPSTQRAQTSAAERANRTTMGRVTSAPERLPIESGLAIVMTNRCYKLLVDEQIVVIETVERAALFARAGSFEKDQTSVCHPKARLLQNAP